jgi:hypothetical protein
MLSQGGGDIRRDTRSEQFQNEGWTEMSVSYSLRRRWGVLKHSIHPPMGGNHQM